MFEGFVKMAFWEGTICFGASVLWNLPGRGACEIKSDVGPLQSRHLCRRGGTINQTQNLQPSGFPRKG